MVSMTAAASIISGIMRRSLSLKAPSSAVSRTGVNWASLAARGERTALSEEREALPENGRVWQATSDPLSAAAMAQPDQCSMHCSRRRIDTLCQVDVSLNHDVAAQPLHHHGNASFEGLFAAEGAGFESRVDCLLDLTLCGDPKVLEQLPQRQVESLL